MCPLSKSWVHRTPPAMRPKPDGYIELPSMLRKRLYPFQHLSPSIAPKRKFLAVDVTVNFPCPAKMSRIFKRLYMPETIEWE